MDVIAGLLDGPRARRAFLLRSVLVPPWSIRVQDEAPLALVAVVRGHAWVVPDNAEPVRISKGDAVVLRGPDHYTVADQPATRPQALIHPDQSCTRLDGGELDWQAGTGVRTWGNASDAVVEATLLVTGTYVARGAISQRLLAALPPVVHVQYPKSDQTLIDVLANEMGKDQLGQQAVLDRLLDLLLVSTLRAWFDRPDAMPPGWYRAQSDPVVGRALLLIQHNPDRPWTLASLAAAVGMSRAGLARRFGNLVGEPPMTFLTTWRLALAADLLSETSDTLDHIARQVGYSNAFALSAAFRRERGMSPREHRLASAPRTSAQ
ncbi:MAG: AraC family transcriptional regulator [Propionibacteriaceae bacterium]